MYLKKLQSELFLTYKRTKNIFFIRILLSLCSIFYLLAYKTRLLLYKLNLLKTYKVPSNVISIGNITSGGTGKTPLTIEIAKHLTSKGYKVAVLSRGYKRKITTNEDKENILVSDGEEILTDFERGGDEPYLIAKNIPKAIVLSGANRIQTAQSAIKLGAQILILDDGFQYLKLFRNENILILDGENPFDNGYLLPAGELRELPDSIKRATVIVVSNPRVEILNEIKKYTNSKPIIEMNYKIKNLKGINIIKTIETEKFSDKKIIAFSGIGNPRSFNNSLTESGFNTIEHIIYADHHNYDVNDISNVIDIAIKNKIENVITTEKDAVKIGYLCEGAPVTFWHSVLETTWNTNDQFNKLLSNLKI